MNNIFYVYANHDIGPDSRTEAFLNLPAPPRPANCWTLWTSSGWERGNVRRFGLKNIIDSISWPHTWAKSVIYMC